MATKLNAALSEKLSPHIDLSKGRLETLTLLITGMIGARTVNLSHIASERGSRVKIASTCRRLQRFFQHVAPDDDWAARLIVALPGLKGPWLPCLDRTNRQIGLRHVNVLVLALVTRRHRVPLTWSMMAGPGNSSTAARIALMDRHLALFGAGSVKMLLADRAFIGGEWLRYLHEDNVPFTIRLKANLTVITEAGQQVRLCTLLRKARGAGCFRAALPGDGGQAPLMLGAGAKRIKGGELLPDASECAASKDVDHALTAYRRRWSIECLFGDAKTRGLNLEDTRLASPRKLSLLLAIMAIAIAWSSKIATTIVGCAARPRKAHGYPAKSWFRTGLDILRNRLRHDTDRAIQPWIAMPQPSRKNRGVV
jgi:hypothetical protein